MNRPTCKSCWRHFVPTGDDRGECHGMLPTIGLIVKQQLVRPGDPEEVERRHQFSWGRWPTISPASAACPLHPDFDRWEENERARRDVEEDDATIF